MDLGQIPQVAQVAGTWTIGLLTVCLVRGQLSIAKEERKIRLYLELSVWPRIGKVVLSWRYIN
jgi:hypothetical protein